MAGWGAELDPPETSSAYGFQKLLNGNLSAEHAEVPIEGLQEMGSAMIVAGLPPEPGRMVYESGLESYVNNGSAPLEDQAIEAGAIMGRRTLESKHGVAVVDKMLADARAIVAVAAEKSPAVLDWLDLSGAGNDPRVIEHLARHVKALRARGDWRKG